MTDTVRRTQDRQALELPPLSIDFAGILEHDAYRIASINTTNGETLFVNDANRELEVGPDWCLVRTGHGENERLVIVRFAAIATVTLREYTESVGPSLAELEGRDPR